MSNKVPLLYDLFTAGKTPELAIFYNLADDNLKKYVSSIDGKVEDLDKVKISDKAFTYLREYLWKGNRQNKNSEGHAATENEILIITEMIRKLKSLRNFQSHIWHDNDVLKFSDPLKKFILDLHDSAVAKVSKDITKDNKLYLDQRKEYPLFKKHNSAYFITQEGRLYFLSFFLNKGEMQLLLSQTKGSKQNNMPEFKFKHEVFTYYCHREGSSWDSSGIMNEELEKMDESRQKKILNGRQAYKIINYLNDAPDYNNREAELPLLFENNDEVIVVENAEQLLKYIEIKQLLQELVFKLPDWSAEADKGPVKGEKERNELKKRLEAKQRDGWMEMQYDKQPWTFEISYQTLKHIVIQIVTGKSISYITEDGTIMHRPAKEHFIRVLNGCIEMRNYLYEQLKQAGDEPVKNDNFKIPKHFTSVYIDYKRYSESTLNVYYEPDQLRNIPILSTPKIEKKLIEWHQSFTLGKKNEVTKRKQLLNLIRPGNAKFDTSLYAGKLKNGMAKVIPVNQKPEPLLFHLSYFYKEQNQKARQEDRFVEWAAKFLIDFDLVPGWYWETEKYIYEKNANADSDNGEKKLKKELRYVQQLPESYRIRVIDNGITIGLPKKENPGNSKDFYKFRLDEKALKFLLLQVFLKRTSVEKNTNDFLLAIKADVESLYRRETNNLQLLDDFAIPGFLKTGSTPAKPTTLKYELKKFIEGRIKWIEENLAQQNQYNRNQKNRIILEAYQLFDFSGTAGAKFLRKNEYEQMSICHFMLNQDPGKVSGLLRDAFNLKSRLPDIILNKVRNSQSLDELFVWVLNNRKQYLKSILKEQLEGDIPVKHLRSLARQFNIKLPASLLTPIAAAERAELRNKHKEDIPFKISPVLVLKYYYPDEFKAGAFTPNPQPGAKPYRNIFKEYRDNKTQNILIKDYYNTQIIEQLLPGSLLQKLEPEQCKQLNAVKRKLTGNLLETLNKDLLLWQMAEQYLQHYDSELYKQISRQQSVGDLNLNNLFHKRTIIELKRSEVPFEKSNYSEEEKRKMPEIIYMHLQMHQVDDYFFRSHKGKLYQLALHFIQRRKEELELYKDRKDITEKIAEWPDGTEEKPVLMSDLINERKICAGFGRELMNHILCFELIVLKDYCDGKIEVKTKVLDDVAIKHKKQQVLEAFAEEHKKALYNKKFISFKLLHRLGKMQTGNDMFEIIKRLRNQCLHSIIPLNGSFRKLVMPGTPVGEALHIINRLGKDRAAENPYEQDEENDVA